MAEKTVVTCDCCGREVPLLGNRGREHDYYRDVFTRTSWAFDSRRFWHIAKRERVSVCGECWEAIGEEVADAD